MNTYAAKCFNKLIIGGFLLLATFSTSYAQTYQVNGSAVDGGSGIVRLTAQGIGNQVGSVWNKTQIDLTQPYDMSFEMFFGCDAGPNGGDGMTFTLQNDPRGLNASGAGFGFLGIGGNVSESIKPAISIEFDTYDGTAGGGLNEIPADHIAIDTNGNVNNTTNVFMGTSGPTTVQAVYNGRDLENCAVNANNYYTVRIVWDPSTKELKLYEEGVLTMTYTNDIVANIFGGNSMVYWGFTGATGSASNEQWIAPDGSIIPWECSAATSCCTPFTVTPTSPSTICNNPITLSVSGTYSSYSWSTGSTAATTQISAPGTYTLNVLQDQGGNSCPGTATFNITPTGPTAAISGGATLCNTALTTPLSVALTGASPWSLTYAVDGITQTPITGITTSPYVIQANGPHVYTLVSVSDNSGCNSNASGSATVDLYTGVPVGHDAGFISPGTANLSVDNNGGTYTWYDAPTAGNLVFTGTAFTTPVLNATTTYYVESSNVPAFTQKSVALHDKSQGTGNDINDQTPDLPAAVCYLEFTANQDFTFDELTCLVNVAGATANGRVTVYITPYSGAAPYTGPETIVKDSLNISVGTIGQTNIVMPLNYACTAGTTYHISYSATNSIQTEMYWQLLPAAGGFPITKDPELTITQPGIPSTRYPGLFDWKISTPSPASMCGRAPVTAYICPLGALSGNAVICNDGIATSPLSVDITGGASSPWTLTYAIDGTAQTPISGITTSPYSFSSATGAHVYTLISVKNATGISCSNATSGTATIQLKPDAPVAINNSFTVPGQALLAVQNTGAVYNWYKTASGTDVVNTGATYLTPALSSTTTYYVEQVVGADTSCSRTAVIATGTKSLEPLFIPNLMTPNNDGKNDVFEIRGLPNEAELVIYNSWGDKVYAAENYENNWAASEVSKGVYYYELKFKTGENYKGWLQIL